MTGPPGIVDRSAVSFWFQLAVVRHPQIIIVLPIAELRFLALH